VNVGDVLLEISEERYVLPRRYNDKFAMTRYFRFEYLSVQDFLDISDLNVLLNDGVFCDGKVLALYSEDKKNYTAKIEEKLKNANCQELIVLYNHKRKLDIVNQIQEYEIVQEIKNDVSFFAVEEHKVLEKEIPIIEEDLEEEIGAYLETSFGNKSGKRAFYLDKGKVRSTKKKRLPDIVDLVCEQVYYAAVSINNELINKENVSSAQIKKARKLIMETLLSAESTDVYMSGTSADSTIYRAVFVGTGIRNKEYKENVEHVMKLIDDFIVGACDNKKPISDIINQLVQKPIGMRKGVIPLYLAYAISQRNEDVIIYFGKKEQQISVEIILNMCDEPDDYFLFVSSEDVEKERYISGLSTLFDVKETTTKSESRLNNVLKGLQRWFRALPQVTKNIKSRNEYWEDDMIAKAFPKIKTLLQSVEANPYEVLFVEIPKAFGGKEYDEILTFISKLKAKASAYLRWITQKAIKETIYVFDKKAKQDLHHTLLEWYERQSDMAKQGLHSSQVTGLMTCIAEISSYDDAEIVKKVVRAVTEIHLDTWNETSLNEYIEELERVKEEIENMDKSAVNSDKNELSFVGKNGEKIVRYYECVDEGTGAILRNIISDTLEDFADLSVNDKIAILLEMIEKELG
jgi:hypothetical protein